MTIRLRRLLGVGIGLLVFAGVMISYAPHQYAQPDVPPEVLAERDGMLASDALALLAVKGRAPKTGYERSQFGSGWASVSGCDMRNTILYRDLLSPVLSGPCTVVSGTLNDPYTGVVIGFTRGQATSADVQIDHVVALSDAWQKGAQQLSSNQRIAFANDPLNLLAVDGDSNQQKGDGDAATWLPPYTAFRCHYVARQIAVKHKYTLWVTQAEKDAMHSVLSRCTGQLLPQ